MQVLSLFIYLFFSVWLVRNILYWLFLWQVKEYRLDRMLIHLSETNQGKMLFTQFDGVAKLILILLYLFAFPQFDTNLTQILTALIFCVYFYDFLFVLSELFSRRLRKPVFTPKTVLICIISLSIIFFLFLKNGNLFFLLAFYDKLATLLIALLIAFFSIPSRIYHGFVIQKARKKILLHPLTKVIGITGCYGKGSTKEYMATILCQKFRVLKTFETHNTPIGIAQTIISDLTKKTEIFLVEIGAYKLGETAQICEIVRPEIGIITPVEDQHLSLFGSLENLKKGTFELIEYLPPAIGLSIFNGNSIHSRQLYEKTDGKRIEKVLCYVNTKGALSNPPLSRMRFTPLVIAYNIKVEKFSVSFDVVLKNKKLGHFTAHLLGAHHIENILPGIYLAHRFGMKIVAIRNGVKKIIPWKKTMEPFETNSGTVLVDDTFNASPGATIAAVNYMHIYNKGKKILVLQPFIELGKNASSDHIRVGEQIGRICDYLLLTNNNFYNEIREGVKKAQRKCSIQIAEPMDIGMFVRQNTGMNDVVVFEGKEAGVSLQRIAKKLRKPI